MTRIIANFGLCTAFPVRHVRSPRRVSREPHASIVTVSVGLSTALPAPFLAALVPCWPLPCGDSPTICARSLWSRRFGKNPAAKENRQ